MEICFCGEAVVTKEKLFMSKLTITYKEDIILTSYYNKWTRSRKQ